MSALLRAGAIAHAVVEGDHLGHVRPAPPDDPDRARITEADPATVRGDFARLGHRRLVRTNTAGVLPEATGLATRALAPGRIVRVLLTASDETVRTRLTAREQGSEREREPARSARTGGCWSGGRWPDRCGWRRTAAASGTSPGPPWPRRGGPARPADTAQRPKTSSKPLLSHARPR
ncbi:hypothetical protein [Streptomyces sp. NPDC085529]|uniref:hypothetical protein n=1 Tax=Streptomyces sp. NPDC085529 TaxID=3365729 RepID=UPI0037D3F6B9